MRLGPLSSKAGRCYVPSSTLSNVAFLFLVLSLAAFRITRIITTDTITEPPREWFLKRFPPDPEHAKLWPRTVVINGKKTTAWVWSAERGSRKISKLGILASCPWCVGFYVSGIAVLVVANLTSIELPVLWWFAVSAVVGLTARNLDNA